MSATVLALLAALAFALGTVLQQRGTLQTSAAEGDPHFLAEIIRKPVWLLGGSLQVCGWVLQAVALERGSLALVQSLCALSLVFALPLGVRLTGQQVGRRSIIGAFATLFGIVSFVALGQPQGGTSQPEPSASLTSGLIFLFAILLLGWLARQRRGRWQQPCLPRALVSATHTRLRSQKCSWCTSQVTARQRSFPSWTTYALILTALVGFTLQQSALKTGFLAPAMAASNASMLIASVLLGVTLFQESISNGQERMLPTILGLCLAVFGVILLCFP